MAHDASQNNPMKEVGYLLVGIVLLLAMILLIGISAFLRPAGDHVTPEPVVDESTQVAPAASSPQPTEAPAAAVATDVQTSDTATAVASPAAAAEADAALAETEGSAPSTSTPLAGETTAQ